MADPSALLAAARPDPAARALYLAILREGGRIRSAEVGPTDRAAEGSPDGGVRWVSSAQPVAAPVGQ
ncbi:hypothetical protein AB0A71_33700 [Kitasatospora aureofaciens]|uniref:hypothetical protein n=1 Tax=Kitasatospora aureofaciens TaxID=1894 RepID=UPI003403DFEF